MTSARRISWQRNLTVVWLSQFLSIMGFAFCLPFGPFFIQSLGVTDPVDLKLWVGLFGAATPLAMALSSPVWGALADRFGRRIMLLRAYGSAAVVVTLMGLVQSVEALVLLRFAQGLLTGTVTAAQTMIAVHTPRNRSGLALGLLSSALFSGALVGAAAGGVFADTFGYRAAFPACSVCFLGAFLLTLFGTRDGDLADEEDEAAPPLLSQTDQVRSVLPILTLIVLMAMVRQFDSAFLPLRVQAIHGSLDGAGRLTGLVLAVASLAGLTGGIVIGRLADRIAPHRLAMLSAVGAGLAMLPQAFIDHLGALAAGRFFMFFFAGGLDPVFQIWLVKETPPARQGLIMGWASTAKSIGWVIAPLAAGAVAAAFGLRTIFWLAGILFLALLPFIHWSVRRIRSGR